MDREAILANEEALLREVIDSLCPPCRWYDHGARTCGWKAANPDTAGACCDGPTFHLEGGCRMGDKKVKCSCSCREVKGEVVQGTDEYPEVEFDCRACGRCCVGPSNVRVAICLNPVDEAKLGTRLAGLTERWKDVRVMAMRDHPDGLACVAFEGRVGESCRCSIYDQRPTVCRGFLPGYHCLGFLAERDRHSVESGGVA